MSEFNFIIRNGNERPGDDALFFPGEEVAHVGPSVTMINLLVISGVFPSNSKARAEFPVLSKKLGLVSMDIPAGWSDFEGIGKMKTRITVLNPIRTVELHE